MPMPLRSSGLSLFDEKKGENAKLNINKVGIPISFA